MHITIYVYIYIYIHIHTHTYVSYVLVVVPRVAEVVQEQHHDPVPAHVLYTDTVL